MADTLTHAGNGATLTFIRLDGHPQPYGSNLIEISRPHVNGHAYKQSSVRGDTFELQGIVDYITPDLQTFYKAFQGSICHIQIAGITYPNYVVLKCGQTSFRPVVNPVGGITAGNYLIRSFWLMQTA